MESARARRGPVQNRARRCPCPLRLLLGGCYGYSPAALGASAADDRATSPGSHSGTEPMGAFATLVMRLIRTLHGNTSGWCGTVMDSRRSFSCQGSIPHIVRVNTYTDRLRWQHNFIDLADPHESGTSRGEVAEPPVTRGFPVPVTVLSCKTAWIPAGYAIQEVGRINPDSTLPIFLHTGAK